MKLSRRELLGGSAALAVAAVLPAPAPPVPQSVVWVAGQNPPAFMVFTHGEIEPLLMDLRPGAINWALQTPERNWFDISLDEEPKLYPLENDRTGRVEYTDDPEGAPSWITDPPLPRNATERVKL